MISDLRKAIFSIVLGNIPCRQGDTRYLRHHYCTLKACGDCGVDTKKRYLEILEFTHFVTFFSFNKICENHKEKILVKKVTVVVALDLDTGNTKNPDNESE